MENGPFKTAVDASKEGIILEEYIVYRKKNGMLVKETSKRNHKTAFGDYHDTSIVEPLAECSIGK